MHKHRPRNVPKNLCFSRILDNVPRNSSFYALYMMLIRAAHKVIRAKGLSTPTFPHYPQGYPQFSWSKALIFGPTVRMPVENHTWKMAYPPVETGLHTSYMSITSLFRTSKKGPHFVGKGPKMSEACRAFPLKKTIFRAGIGLYCIKRSFAPKS